MCTLPFRYATPLAYLRLVGALFKAESILQVSGSLGRLAVTTLVAAGLFAAASILACRSDAKPNASRGSILQELAASALREQSSARCGDTAAVRIVRGLVNRYMPLQSCGVHRDGVTRYVYLDSSGHAVVSGWAAAVSSSSMTHFDGRLTTKRLQRSFWSE